MLRSFNDDSLPSTRRSIIVFSILSVLMYFYRPTIYLGDLDVLQSLAENEVKPKYFAFTFLFSIGYLMWRLTYLTPLYRYNAEQVFSEYLKRLEDRSGSMLEQIQGVLNELRKIEVSTVNAGIREIDDIRKEVIGRIDELIVKVDRAEATVRTKAEKFTEIHERIANDIRVARLKSDTTEGGTDVNEWKDHVLDIREIPKNLTSTFNILQTVLNDNRSDLSDIDLRDISIEIHDIEKSIREYESLKLSSIDILKDEALNARSTSQAEASVFSVLVPTLFSALGIAACVLVLIIPYEEFMSMSFQNSLFALLLATGCFLPAALVFLDGIKTYARPYKL